MRTLPEILALYIPALWDMMGNQPALLHRNRCRAQSKPIALDAAGRGGLVLRFTAGFAEEFARPGGLLLVDPDPGEVSCLPPPRVSH